MLLGLAYNQDNPPVVYLFGEAVAGWAIIATFLALLALH